MGATVCSDEMKVYDSRKEHCGPIGCSINSIWAPDVQELEKERKKVNAWMLGNIRSHDHRHNSSQNIGSGITLLCRHQNFHDKSILITIFTRLLYGVGSGWHPVKFQHGAIFSFKEKPLNSVIHPGIPILHAIIGKKNLPKVTFSKVATNSLSSRSTRSQHCEIVDWLLPPFVAQLSI